MGWLDSKPPCVVCKDIYKDMGSDPPCNDCIVKLNRHNEEAVKVYLACRSQVIRAGMDGTPVAPDILAIIAVMNLYEVTNPKDCFWRVMHLFSHFMSERLRQEHEESRKVKRDLRY